MGDKAELLPNNYRIVVGKGRLELHGTLVDLRALSKKYNPQISMRQIIKSEMGRVNRDGK